MPAPHVPSTGQPSNPSILLTGKSNNDSYTVDTWANGTLSNKGETKIVFIDYPAHGDTLLIDGCECQGSDAVLSVLNELAISEIKGLVATHPYADQI
jgi:beta-lactamase superfamily II metal-dependent hydrolase